MKEVTDYTVVYSTFGEVDELVKALIGDGWHPLGGISISRNEDDKTNPVRTAQAMIRYEEESK